MSKSKKAKKERVFDSDYLLKFIGEGLVTKFLGPIFENLPITPNQVTLANFLTNNLFAVYFFSQGNHQSYLIGLFFCALSSINDKVDGFLARKKGLTSDLGGWLDATLDLIWQNSLLGAIVYGVSISKDNDPRWIALGLFAMVSLAMSNSLRNLYRDNFNLGFHGDVTEFRQRMRTSEKADFIDKLFLQIIAPTNFLYLSLFTIRYFIVFGALANLMDLALIAIALSCFVKSIILFYIYALFLSRKNHRAVTKILETLTK